MSKDANLVRERIRQMTPGTAFLAEGTARAMVLRWEHASYMTVHGNETTTELGLLDCANDLSFSSDTSEKESECFEQS